MVRIILILLFLFVQISFIVFFEPVSAEIKFEDVTEKSGISYVGGSWGAYWGDYNSDGWADLWMGNHGNSPKLYQNNHDGTFVDVSSKIIESTKRKDPHGASWADFDNDGDMDLLVLTGAFRGQGERKNFFYVNNDGSLEEKSEYFGLSYPLGRGRTPLWFDVDNDGFLDAILSNNRRPDTLAGTVIFHQKNSTFQDVTPTSNLEFSSSVGSSSAQISDIIGNKKMELLFLVPSPEGIYDTTSYPFKNIRKDLNLPNLWAADVAIADYNGDLLPDLFLSRMLNRDNVEKEPRARDDKLFINTGNGFIDKTSESEFSNPTECRSSVAGDFDNDGDIDIYSVCTQYEKNLPNILLENVGNGVFKVLKAGDAAGSKNGIGDSVSLVDYDNDGFLDLFVTNGYGNTNEAHEGPVQLFRNLGNQNHWLEIDLIGTNSNKDGIGSKVIIESDSISQMREQNGGMHFRSQNYKRLHFGLADNTVVDSVKVYWPSGIAHEITNITSDTILKIIEPQQPIPPNHQKSLGLKPSEIICKKNFQSIIKPNTDKVKCVKPSTAEVLIERGTHSFMD